MARAAVVIDQGYLKHDPGKFHPERPDRIRILLKLAEQLDRSRFQRLPPRSATFEELSYCHTTEYIQLVRDTSDQNSYALDGDTVTCRDSYGTGLLAVGGFLRLLDSITSSESKCGFALVRPPGHHATRDRAMGFCLFNTIAIGARYLQRRHGVGRVSIIDWDVHHGNGTQDIFYNDPSVLYLSTHQYPFYPGTGACDEVGKGSGKGTTVNIPMPSGCGDKEYEAVFNEIVCPSIERYQPEWILVSAGFDPHRRDPLAGMDVTEKGFSEMAALLIRMAEKYSGGKIAFLLEGGYDLEALKASTSSVLEQLEGSGKEPLATAVGGERIRPLIRRILDLQERYIQGKS